MRGSGARIREGMEGSYEYNEGRIKEWEEKLRELWDIISAWSNTSQINWLAASNDSAPYLNYDKAVS